MKSAIIQQRLSLKQDNGHRLEFVAEQQGVTYINDSASTNISQTILSIDGFDAELVLIIGGNDAKTDYTCFLNIGLQKIRSVIYLGQTPASLFRIFGKENCFFVTADSVGESLQIARLLAKPGQVVLFSPACPSYEVFDNYKNRGNKFKALVLGQ